MNVVGLLMLNTMGFDTDAENDDGFVGDGLPVGAAAPAGSDLH